MVTPISTGFYDRKYPHHARRFCTMNIFVFHKSPRDCARAHGDRHVVKMVLETAQILCTVNHLKDNPAPYRKTHTKHPCVLWVLESRANYRWLIELGLSLAAEYTHRYDRRHKSQDVIEWCRDHEPDLPDCPMTPFVQCMPDHYRSDDTVASYRRYFIGEKSHLGQWTRRDAPTWFPPRAEG